MDNLKSYVHLGVVLWSIVIFCDTGQACPEGQVTNPCGSPCDRTCQNPNPICAQVCVERCQCPSDKVLHDGECISMEKCAETSFLLTPENTHTKVGGTARFVCNIEGSRSVTWINPNDDVIPNDVDKYSIDGTQLTIRDVELDDAGSYLCQDALNEDLNFQAELIVLESNPTCTTSIESSNIAIEGETINYRCDVTYRGQWAPHMIWKDQSGQTLMSVNEDIPDSHIAEEFVLTVTSEDNDRSFSCYTGFGNALDPSPDDNEALNIPNYTHVKHFEPITVHYPPRQPTISPLSSTITTDQSLTCSAQANPAVQQYEWRNLSHPQQEEISNHQILEIPDSWVGQALHLRCTAFNTMRGQRSGSHRLDIEFTVLDSSGEEFTGDDSGENSSLSTAGISGIAVAGVVVLVVVVIVGALLFIHKRRHKQHTNENIKPNDNNYETPKPAHSTIDSKLYTGLVGPYETPLYNATDSKLYTDVADPYEQIPAYDDVRVQDKDIPVYTEIIAE